MRRGLWALILLAVTAPSRAAEVTFLSEDGTALRAIHVAPAAGVPRRPAVVALHGCAGLAPPGQPLRLPPREQDWAERLAALGHAVVLPDSFGSRGMGPACGRPDHPAGPKGLRPEDARAALASAAALPGEPPGGGICSAGRRVAAPCSGLWRLHPRRGSCVRRSPSIRAAVPSCARRRPGRRRSPSSCCSARPMTGPPPIAARRWWPAHRRRSSSGCLPGRITVSTILRQNSARGACPMDER